MWRRIHGLIVKELLAVWRDRRSRLMLIVPPVVQLVVFTFAMTQEVRNVRMAVVNQDLSAYSRDLVAGFAGSGYFASVRALRGPADIRPAIDSGDVLLVLQIDEGFSRALAAGQPASVQLILDGRRSNAAQIVQGYAQAITARFNDELAQRGGTGGSRSVVVARTEFNPNLETRWSTVPGLVGTLTMMIALLVTALSVAREREVGTFEQLLVSPLRPAEILLGKTIPALLIGLAEGTVILVIGVLVLRVPFVGSLPLLYLAITVYMTAVIGVGLFLSSLVVTQQQAILGAFTFFMPAVLLSGFMTPIENMPDWVQALTLVNPARYFMVIARGLFLKAMPAREVLAQVWPMAAIALATLAASAWLFRRRLE
jgi:ABC-2 type transport system permease protein